MSLLSMSMTGGAVILAALAARIRLIGRKLPRQTFLLLWGIALFCLFVPISLPPIFGGEAISIRLPMGSYAGSAVSVPSGNPAGAAPDSAGAAGSVVSPWAAVWAIGFALCLLWFSIAYLRCWRRFRQAVPAEDEQLAVWLEQHRGRRPIRIYRLDGLEAPLTYGVLRPVILLPEGMDCSDSQMELILEHELIHIRRFDTLMKLLLGAALCIHWFNPLVWVMYLLANRDMELACDEAVLRRKGEAIRSTYARALIGMEERRSGLLPMGSAFGRNAVEERIGAIMRYKKRTKAAVFLSAAVVAAILLGAVCAGGYLLLSRELPSTPDRLPKTGETVAPTGTVQAQSVAFEGVELRAYDDGWPYLHDVFTNHTNKTITEMVYGMLAYDKSGEALELHWDIADSSAESSYDCLVRLSCSLAPGQTLDEDGGWSLYDEEKMTGWPKLGEGGPNRVEHALYAVKQLTFGDGTVWENPEYGDWLETYRAKRVPLSALERYYPYEQEVTLE